MPKGVKAVDPLRAAHVALIQEQLREILPGEIGKFFANVAGGAAAPKRRGGRPRKEEQAA